MTELEIIRETKKLINKKHKEWGIPVAYPELEEKELSYEEAKNDFLTKYARSFEISDNAEEEYNQHRINKYGGTGEENEKK